MRRRPRILLTLASGAMFLSCFFAWEAFLFACVRRGAVSPFEGALVLSTAALVQSFHHRRGWRLMTVASLHAAGLLLSFHWLVQCQFASAPAFWRPDRAPAFWTTQRPALDWVALFFLALCVASLWFSGTRLISRPPTQSNLSRRFDAGLGSLLLLLLTRLIVAIKGASIPGDPSPLAPVVAFFLLGLFSMGLARVENAALSDAAVTIKAAGVLWSFTIVTVFLGGGLFLLFLPELKTAAEMGFSLLGSMKTPLEHLVILLARLYTGRSPVTARQGLDSVQALPALPGEHGGGLLGIIVFCLLAAPVLLMAMAVVAFLLLRLVQWLWRKMVSTSDREGGGQGAAGWLADAIDLLRRMLQAIVSAVFLRRPQVPSARVLFGRLLRWGRYSGLICAACETPAEYGRRLGRRFPQVEEEISVLVGLHEAAVYAETAPDDLDIVRGRSAFRRLRHPRLWPARLRSLLFSSDVAGVK